ncbi:MAG: DUF2911 domain-containing protein [Gemmatimonadota bacterium]
MHLRSSRLLGSVTLALALVAARRAPGLAVTQGSDGCTLQEKPERVAQRKSPHDSAAVALEGGTVKVCYGRPHQNGRAIMGKLLPYGEPWRIGADEATVIHVPFAASIAGVKVEPGWYSLYAVPGAKEWKIVVNSEPVRWGVPIDAAVQTKDIGSGMVASEHLATPAEQLTITLSKASAAKATMDIAWSDTHVRVPIEKR